MLTLSSRHFKVMLVNEHALYICMHLKRVFLCFIMLPPELLCEFLASLSIQFLGCEPVSCSPSSADIKSY